MYLDCKFGLSLSLSEISLLFDLSLDLDGTLAQWKAQRQAKSKVSHPFTNKDTVYGLLATPQSNHWLTNLSYFLIDGITLSGVAPT